MGFLGASLGSDERKHVFCIRPSTVSPFRCWSQGDHSLHLHGDLGAGLCQHRARERVKAPRRPLRKAQCPSLFKDVLINTCWVDLWRVSLPDITWYCLIWTIFNQRCVETVSASSESLPGTFSKWLPSCKMAAKVWLHWTGPKWWPTSQNLPDDFFSFFSYFLFFFFLSFPK